MYIYAVINENGVCCLFHTSETEINDASYILVEAADSNMVYRKKWDAETETWVDTDPTEVPVENSRRLTHTDDDGTSSGLDADTLDGLEASAFAAAEHTHDGYAASTHTHDGYAAADHSHSGYASSSHTHSDYFEKTGGTISGGLVRVGGQQCLYNSGSMITLSTNNMPTQIAGSAVYSSKAISVSSDRRLKDDVRHVNKEAFVDFIKKINLVSYRYKEEPADTKHIGVIAQQLLEINKDLASYFVCEDRDGYYSVDYAALALVAAAVALQ